MKPSSEPITERKPGRSFENPSRPLGEELIEHAKPSVAPTAEDFRSRTVQAREQAEADRYGVAERAKVISVLRKAEEVMASPAGAPATEADLRSVLELVAHDVGLTFREYRALMKGDEELIQLEKQVLDDARRRWLHKQP